MGHSILHHLKLKDRFLGVIVPILVVVVWQIAVKQHLFSELLLVPPLTVLNTLIELAASGDLTTNVLASMSRVLLGFMVGGFSGFILGASMGLSPVINRMLGPLIKSLQQVPEFAWMPMIILLFGVEELPKVLFIAIGAFYPMLFNTYQGVSGVPKKYYELAQVFDYKTPRYLLKVVIPSALPSIITGIRMSLGLSWMFVVGAELFGTESGVGFMLSWGRQLFQIDVVIAALIVTGLIGFVLNSVLQIIEKNLLRWQVSYDGGNA